MEQKDTTNTNRKSEINIINVMLCLFVVYAHIASEAIMTLDKSSTVLLIIYAPWRLATIAVPIFVFLSGLKFMLSYEKNSKFSYPKYMLSKVKSIIIPYLIWVIIYYVYFCSIGYFPFKISDLISYMTLGNLVSPFYFVIFIMQFYLLCLLWVKLVKKVNPTILIVLSVFITIIFGQFFPEILKLIDPNINFIYNDRIFTSYLIYWIIGCYVGLNYDKFIDIITHNKLIIISISLITIISDVYLSHLSFTKGVYVPYLETLHVLYYLSTILSIYILSLYIVKKFSFIHKSKLFKLVNGSTYYVYLIHCLVITYLNNNLAKYGIVSIRDAFIFKFFVTYIVTFGICALYVFIKNIITKALKKKEII